MKGFLYIFLKQRKKSSNYSVLLLTVALVVLMATTNILVQITNNNQEFEGLNENSYSLIDNWSSEYENAFFSKPGGLGKIKSFYRSLISDETFEYGVLTEQPIGIPDLNLDVRFFNGYGSRPMEYVETNVYNSIQINDVGLKKSRINLTEGRFFEEEEYQYYTGKILPVLLGSELKEFFSLNDHIPIQYLGVEIEYKVVGFLEVDSYIINRNRNVVFLNRYFILPAIDYVDDGMAGAMADFQRKVYLQKTNGIIYTDLTALAIQSKIEAYCRALEMKPYVLMGLPNINILGLETKEIIILFLAISVLLLFISIISIMMNILSRTDQMMKTYAIHHLCGAKKGRLVSYILVEMVVSMALAIGFVYGLQYLFFGIIGANWYLQLSILLVFIIPPLPSILKVYNMNIPKQIRR